MSQNTLYPIFLNLSKLRLLVVGAGQVSQEKLSFILKSSPNARIKVIAPMIIPETERIINNNMDAISYVPRVFIEGDVIDADIVVAATNIPEVNYQVWAAAKKYRKIVNVADTPRLCDFYMGSIVTKGDVKIGISTNGMSPTFAKRLRQWLEKVLPDETNELVKRLKNYRDKLPSDFNTRVKELDALTSNLK